MKLTKYKLADIGKVVTGKSPNSFGRRICRLTVVTNKSCCFFVPSTAFDVA